MTTKITSNMVFELKYDEKSNQKQSNAISNDKPVQPSIAIIFKGGDLNAAAHYVAQSAQNPFDESVISTVLIQESTYDSFIDKVRSNLKQLNPQVAEHPNYRRTKDAIQRLNAKTITAKDANNDAPILVCEFPQAYFGAWPTGVLNVHSFRTAKEAQDLYQKQSLPYQSVVIFNESISGSYEIATALNAKIFYINCTQVPLEPILNHYTNKTNYVTIEQNYHYETIKLNNEQKIIIFPIGTIFAN